MRAPGRRRRPSLWRRALRFVPRPSLSREPRPDPLAALQHEIAELRLAVAALRADVVSLHDRVAVAESAPAPAVQPDVVVVDAAFAAAADIAAPDSSGVTIVLPIARAARDAGIPADGVVAVDLGADSVPTEIVLEPATSTSSTNAPLPEAPLLDPRVARVAEALDDLVAEAEPERPVAAVRETA